MPVNLIPTKIIIPGRSPSVIRRSRLVDYLHENLGRKLLLVAAPAGYGKTTLLIDFASDVDFPVCWYTLDEEDRDPSTFLAHLVASIRLKFPRFGARSASLSEQGTLSARAAAAALVADMVDDVPEYFVLVLDDWHLVSDEAAISNLLDQLLRYLPEHAHLIVAGRALPRGPLVRLAAQSAVAGLGPADLRFNAAEVHEVLASRFNIPVTAERADKLANESEGWITGILLTSQRAWRGLLSGLIQDAGPTGTLYDYLAGEVFDRLPPRLGRFLVESATPRQFCAALCDDLRGVPDSETWIKQVEANNLFLTGIVVDGETWYRYHQLFREFLLARFQRDAPADFTRLQLRCGELFEFRQQPEEAVEHYVAAGAFDRAARVMDSAARSLALAGRMQTLLRWADLLPKEYRLAAPELILFQGRALTERGFPAEALQVIDQAATGFRARGDTIGQIRAALEKGWTHHARGKLRDALTVGQALLRQLEEASLEEPLLTAHALRLVGSTYSSMGQWQNGEKYLAQALAVYRHGNSDVGRAYDLGRTLHDLAYALRFMGRLEEATTLEAESLAFWRGIGNPGPLAASLNNAGYDRFLVGDYEGALKLYTEALTKAEEAEDRRLQAYALEGIAAAHRDRVELQEALKVYEHVLELAHEIGDQSLVSWALDGLGHAYRLAGELDRALALFEQARSLAERGEISSQAALSAASIGIALVEQGRIDTGVADLEHVSRQLQSSESHFDLARVTLWLGRAYFDNKQHALAREKLVEVMRLGGRLGCRPFSLAEGRHAWTFLAWGSEQPLSGVQRLERWLNELREEVRPLPSLAEEAPAPRIEVRAFGSGQVFRNGRMLAASAWEGAAIARELLFYLLEHSPQRKEEIGAVFWPKLTSARMTSAFHAAKYKARRALGIEFAIYESDRYRVDPSAGIWYDVAEFEQLLASAYRRSTDDPVRLEQLEQAVALYTADYLGDLYSDWVVDRRRMLQGRYFDALRQLVDGLFQNRQFERALFLCQRGIERDFYREELHRRLILCLVELDRLTEALTHYDTMTLRLIQELHTYPEAETIALAARIRSQ